MSPGLRTCLNSEVFRAKAFPIIIMEIIMIMIIIIILIIMIMSIMAIII